MDSVTFSDYSSCYSTFVRLLYRRTASFTTLYQEPVALTTCIYQLIICCVRCARNIKKQRRAAQIKTIRVCVVYRWEDDHQDTKRPLSSAFQDFSVAFVDLDRCFYHVDRIAWETLWVSIRTLRNTIIRDTMNPVCHVGNVCPASCMSDIFI